MCGFGLVFVFGYWAGIVLDRAVATVQYGTYS
jgi:hypothetical protein